jgi:hypothetical protein
MVVWSTWGVRSENCSPERGGRISALRSKSVRIVTGDSEICVSIHNFRRVGGRVLSKNWRTEEAVRKRVNVDIAPDIGSIIYKYPLISLEP